jgi:hypothetical protein
LQSLIARGLQTQDASAEKTPWIMMRLSGTAS